MIELVMIIILPTFLSGFVLGYGVREIISRRRRARVRRRLRDEQL
jgi:hypothetical protein